jgi:hypothetical protein
MTVVAFKVKGSFALVEPHMKYMYKGCSFLESLARFETPLEEVKDHEGKTTKWIRDEEKYVKIAREQQNVWKKTWDFIIVELKKIQEEKKQKEEEKEKLNKMLEKKQKMEKKQNMKKKQKQLLKEKEMEEEEEINKAILDSKYQKIDNFEILGEFSNITNFKGEKFIFIEGEVPILDKDNNYYNVFLLIQNMKHAMVLDLLKKFKNLVETFDFPTQRQLKPYMLALSCGSIPEKPTGFYKDNPKKSKSILLLLRCIYFMVSRTLLFRKVFQMEMEGKEGKNKLEEEKEQDKEIITALLSGNTIMQNFFLMGLENHFTFTMQMCANELEGSRNIQSKQIKELMECFQELQIFFVELEFHLFRALFPLPTLPSFPTRRQGYLVNLSNENVEELFLNWTLINVEPPKTSEFYKKNTKYFETVWEMGKNTRKQWIQSFHAIKDFYRSKTFYLETYDIKHVEKIFGKNSPYFEKQTLKDYSRMKDLEHFLSKIVKVKKEDNIAALVLSFITNKNILESFFAIH